MDLTAKQFTPQPVNESQELHDRLPCEWINNKHELMHKPFDWEVVDGEWLPILSPIYFIPSLNNYDLDGVKDPENVRAIYRNKGCACIPNGDQRLGKYAQYMATIDAYNPQMGGSTGKYWVTIFDSPISVAGRVKWQRDVKAFNDFRRTLVAADICKMNATIATMVLERVQESLTAMHQIPVSSKNKADTVARLEKNIADMKAVMNGLEKPKAAAQPRARRFSSTPATEEAI